MKISITPTYESNFKAAVRAMSRGQAPPRARRLIEVEVYAAIESDEDPLPRWLHQVCAAAAERCRIEHVDCSIEHFRRARATSQQLSAGLWRVTMKARP